MFGMFSIDAAEGFMERRDKLDTRRSDIARRFNEYRKANPYATALDLQNYADSLVGSDFFLRPGNATGDALQNIAKQNAVNRQIRDRGRVMDALEQDQKLGGQVTEFFTRQFKLTGDADVALQNTKDTFLMDKPGDPRMDSIINNALSDIESGKDALVQNIIYQGIGENKDLITGQINMGMDLETLERSLPPYLQGEFTRNFLKSQEQIYDQGQRETVYGQAVAMLKDPVVEKALGFGDYSIIRERLGPERFDKYNQDNRLKTHIKNMFNTSRIEQWNERSRAGYTAALERATGRRDTAIARQQSAFAGYIEGAESDTDLAAVRALNFLNSKVIDPSAFRKIMRILNNNTSTNPDDIINLIEAELEPNELMESNEFIERETGQYLNMLGLGGQEPQTFMDWKDQNLGPKGQIPSQVETAINTTSSALGNTSQLYGGTNRFGLITPSAYQQHATDLANAIRMAEETKNDISQSRRAIRSQYNFLGSFREGENGEPINVPQQQDEADKQLYAEENKINNHLEALRKRLIEVRRQAMTQGSTNRPFTSYTGPEITDAAQAMARYAAGQNMTSRAELQRLALQYAAMMGVRDGNQPGQGVASGDQKELARALLNALP